MEKEDTEVSSITTPAGMISCAKTTTIYPNNKRNQGKNTIIADNPATIHTKAIGNRKA